MCSVRSTGTKKELLKRRRTEVVPGRCIPGTDQFVISAGRPKWNAYLRAWVLDWKWEVRPTFEQGAGI